jgi:excisionase family DNA binding protein
MPEERPVRSIDDLPIALTVSEAAEALRVCRNTIYALIRLWHATGGARGLRAVRLGRALRIPRIAILEFLGIVPPHPGGDGFDRGTGGDRGAA